MVDFSKTENHMFQKALEKWDINFQFGCANEEMGELIAVINQYKRGRVDERAVIEEVADVLIMMGQLRYYFGEDAVDEMVIEKMKKLKNYLDK